MAKIKLNTKEEFFAYAKKVLKEEILRLQEAKAEETIKAKRLPSDDTTPESEMKKIEAKKKKEDVRNELESGEAYWTTAGFQKRKPTPPTGKFDRKLDKFPPGVPKYDPAIHNFPDPHTLTRDVSVHMKDEPVEDEDKPNLGIEKRGDLEGFDRTAAERKAERLAVDVSGASDYTEERGLRNLKDYKNYLARMLLIPSVGFEKKNHRMLVSATNTETGETEDAMLEDLSPEALIDLAIQQPSLLNPKIGSFESFFRDVRGDTPIADMYDPEMDKDKFTFELGDIVPGVSKKKEKDGYYGKEQDRLDMSQEDVAAYFGEPKSQGQGVAKPEISALVKYGNLYNKSFMKAAEIQSAKLADLTTDFLMEFEDQVVSGDEAQYELAFSEFLRLLIEKGLVGQYIGPLVSGGKVGGVKFTPALISQLYTRIDEIAARVVELSDNPKQAKTAEDKLLLSFAQKPIALELMVEERDGIMDLFEHATELFMDEEMDEETLREKLTKYISTEAAGLYGHREKVSAAASPKLRTSPELEKDIQSRLRARQKDQEKKQKLKAAK
ncbi:MAG TPA: hypothetical protein PLP33_07365 [Leptospiraceae bacterium]|nr:hypothetical protein [Leptospiraceae bacterium]